jgi:pyruvate formate lyase activating enzyme
MIISSLEFPGNVSLVIFTGGCILKCPYCHNPEIIDGGKSVEMDEIIKKIDNSMEFIDSVVITGGEPLIQNEEVKNILRYAKSRGLKTKLDTNGFFVHELEEVMDLLDYVALDIKAPFGKYKEIIGSSIDNEVRKSMESCIKADVYLECRTTFVPYLMEDIVEIAKNIDANIYYTLQQFRDKKVLDKKLYGTPIPSRDELKEIAEMIKPFLKHIKIKTAEFGDEIIK